MGGGIAQILALAGMRVALADVSADIARRSLDRVLDEARAFESAGLMPAGAAATVERNVWAAPTAEEAVADGQFIMEAVPEIIGVKHAVLKRLSAAAPSDAVIASNTSTISIGKLAVAVGNPERFLGIHFMNPAQFVPGVEVVPHAATSPRAVESARAILDAAGKRHATIKDSTGFVVNRLQYALFSEAVRLVEEGVATPEAIDTLVRTSFGFRLPFFGPFAIADMAGLDVYALCYESLESAFPERFAMPEMLRQLVDAGDVGTKVGSGFFQVPPERIAELVSYRNTAYSRLQRLTEELGPAPLD